jgi:hypothetical protein
MIVVKPWILWKRFGLKVGRVVGFRIDLVMYLLSRFKQIDELKNSTRSVVREASKGCIC